MREPIDDFIRETPYNNFRKVLEANGEACEEKFGGSCIYQCERFAERLKKVGSTDLKFITTSPFHCALLDARDEEIFFYDPTMLIYSRVPLKGMIREAGKQVALAYPVLESSPTVWFINSNGPHTFNVQRRRSIYTDRYDLRGSRMLAPRLPSTSVYNNEGFFTWNVVQDQGIVKIKFNISSEELNVSCDGEVPGFSQDPEDTLKRYDLSLSELMEQFKKAAFYARRNRQFFEECGI